MKPSLGYELSAVTTIVVTIRSVKLAAVPVKKTAMGRESCGRPSRDG